MRFKVLFAMDLATENASSKQSTHQMLIAKNFSVREMETPPFSKSPKKWKRGVSISLHAEILCDEHLMCTSVIASAFNTQIHCKENFEDILLQNNSKKRHSGVPVASNTTGIAQNTFQTSDKNVLA